MRKGEREERHRGKETGNYERKRQKEQIEREEHGDRDREIETERPRDSDWREKEKQKQRHKLIETESKGEETQGAERKMCQKWWQSWEHLVGEGCTLTSVAAS